MWLRILPFTGHAQFCPHEYIFSIIYRARFRQETEFYVLDLYKKKLLDPVFEL